VRVAAAVGLPAAVVGITIGVGLAPGVPVTAAVAVGMAVAVASEPPPSSVPADRGERSPEAAPRRPTYETEDLDIPAFLRRNR